MLCAFRFVSAANNGGIHMGVLSSGGVGTRSRFRQRDHLSGERGRGAARAELCARRCATTRMNILAVRARRAPDAGPHAEGRGARLSPVQGGAVADVESAAALLRRPLRKGARQAPRAGEEPVWWWRWRRAARAWRPPCAGEARFAPPARAGRRCCARPGGRGAGRGRARATIACGCMVVVIGGSTTRGQPCCP